MGSTTKLTIACLLGALLSLGCGKDTCPAGDVGCVFGSMTVSDFLAGGGSSVGGPPETLTSIDPSVLSARVGAATSKPIQLSSASRSLTYSNAGDGAILGLQWTDPNGCRPAFCLSACPKGAQCIATRCAPSARDGINHGFTEDWVTYAKTAPAPLDFDLQVVAVSAPGCPEDLTAAIASATSQVTFSQVVSVPVTIDSGGGGGGGAGSSCCADWTCNGSTQCAAVMGSPSGKQCVFAGGATDINACNAWGNKFIPRGYTCRCN